MRDGRTHILLFLKAPRPRTVKTRLAEGVGVDQATRAYRALVQRQLGVLSALSQDFAIEVHYAPADAMSEMLEWLGPEIPFYPQFEGDLGERLMQASSSAFQRGAKHVFCIGGDCPELCSTHFEEAAHFLEADTELVIGPSEDGGYYLIAMRRFTPELFQEIPWSTRETCQATVEKANSLEMKINFLETLYDVDTEAEFTRAIASGSIQL